LTNLELFFRIGRPNKQSFVKLQQFPITIPEAKALHSILNCILAQKAEYLQLNVDHQNLVILPNPQTTGFQLQPALRQQGGTQCNVLHQLQISDIFKELQTCTHSAGALANTEHLSISLMSVNTENLNVIILFS
jgi:hypothetical protein